MSCGCDGEPHESTTIGRSSLRSSWLKESTIAVGDCSSVAPFSGSIDWSELVSSWAWAGTTGGEDGEGPQCPEEDCGQRPLEHPGGIWA